MNPTSPHPLSGTFYTCPAGCCQGKVYFPGPCIFCCCVYRAECIRTGELGIAEKFGQYSRTLDPGVHFMVDICGVYQEELKTRISTRARQLNLHQQAYKTRDHVIVHIDASIIYEISHGNAYDACYKLQDPESQISDYTDDRLRQAISLINVDDIFLATDTLNDNVRNDLNGKLNSYGWNIKEVLITKLLPEQRVMNSMNTIEQNRRLKLAQLHRGEAIKIAEVKAAEGEAESSYLRGVGTSRQRGAIQNGFNEMVTEFSDFTGLEEDAVRALIYTTQYFDGIKDMTRGKAGVAPSTILLGHDPASLLHNTEQLHETLGEGYRKFMSFPDGAVERAHVRMEETRKREDAALAAMPDAEEMERARATHALQ